MASASRAPNPHIDRDNVLGRLEGAVDAVAKLTADHDPGRRRR
jgi:hypothetical protein